MKTTQHYGISYFEKYSHSLLLQLSSEIINAQLLETKYHRRCASFCSEWLNGPLISNLLLVMYVVSYCISVDVYINFAIWTNQISVTC